jgi:hypothetical protein
MTMADVTRADVPLERQPTATCTARSWPERQLRSLGQKEVTDFVSLPGDVADDVVQRYHAVGVAAVIDDG